MRDSAEIANSVLEPFVTATRAALAEMAGIDVVVRSTCQNSNDRAAGDMAVILRLTSATEAFLVLSFPERTAAALARRMLAGVSAEVDEQLIRECIGEVGNVIAGQAKALQAGTPRHFSFSLPEVVSSANDFQPPSGLDCLAVDFMSDQGAFVLQLFLKL